MRAVGRGYGMRDAAVAAVALSLGALAVGGIIVLGVNALVFDCTEPRIKRYRTWLAAGVLVISVGGGVWYYVASTQPIDDPSFFCQTPEPSPAASISASIILQECSADKTITVAKGDAIAVDLADTVGIDTWDQWSDPSASDGAVLTRVSGPTIVSSDSLYRVDKVTVYTASHTGQATLSAVYEGCSANTNTCDRGHRWMVTIRVT